jgi:hypothetical protein
MYTEYSMILDVLKALYVLATGKHSCKVARGILYIDSGRADLGARDSKEQTPIPCSFAD